MEIQIIDQQQLNQERIRQNARLYELGVLALSGKEAIEVSRFLAGQLVPQQVAV